jgi:hypothetical protein
MSTQELLGIVTTLATFTAALSLIAFALYHLIWKR